MAIDRIEWQGKTLAIVIRYGHGKPGVDFVTEADNPLQLGVLQHARGTTIKAHTHKQTPRTITLAQEILHIEYGRVLTTFYDTAGNRVSDTVLEDGDTILLIDGGHGFNIIEDARILEIKQGPYGGILADKNILKPNP